MVSASAANVGPRFVKLAVNHRLVGSFQHGLLIQLLPIEVCKHDVTGLGKEQPAFLPAPAANEHGNTIGAARAHVAGCFFEQAELGEDLASQRDFFG